jgi:hypothetical protein
LRVLSCCHSRRTKQDQKHQEPSEKASEEVKDASTRQHGKEKKFSFDSKNGERLVQRSMDWVNASVIIHGIESPRFSGKKPRHEIHSADGHSDSKQNPRQHPFRIALSERKHETAPYNADEAETSGDWTRERSLESIYGVLPR